MDDINDQIAFFKTVHEELDRITAPDGERLLSWDVDRVGYMSKHAAATVVYNPVGDELNILLWNDTTGGEPRPLLDADGAAIHLATLEGQPYLLAKFIQTAVSLYSLTGPTVTDWEELLVEVAYATECMNG